MDKTNIESFRVSIQAKFFTSSSRQYEIKYDREVRLYLDKVKTYDSILTYDKTVVNCNY